MGTTELLMLGRDHPGGWGGRADRSSAPLGLFTLQKPDPIPSCDKPPGLFN